MSGAKTDAKTDKVLNQAASVLALIVGVFHLLNVSGLIVLSTMIVRIFHLALMLAIVFLTRPMASKGMGRGIDLFLRALLLALSLGVGAYLILRWEAIALSGGLVTQWDTMVGVLLIAVVLVATWRGVGTALGVIALLFLVYPFVTRYLPGIFRSRPFSFQRIFSFLSFSTEGIYGIPIGVSSTYIILFTTYGAFLSQFGAGEFFYRLSSLVTRRMTAPGAKTAVIFSTLIGMISGSAAGNVAVTGSFTIPLMKREGYKPHEAAAVEAVVSTGGQLMPPVMGAAAFIMAEIIGRPYVDIMKAGLLPALLFFISSFFVVHLQAKRSGLKPRQDGDAPREKLGAVLVGGIQFIIPFLALILMMVRGYSPFKACFWSILMLLATHLLWKRRIGREFFAMTGRAIADGARSAVPIAIACAAAGIISGVLSVTGLGSKLSALIVSVSGGVPLVALVLTMITSFILGMGLPTTAAYLILATVVTPALAQMGVPLLTAHMFVFFYGCISTITPPVALAAYVAGGIAGADINKSGWTAFRYGLTSYVLPFMFVYGPSLLMQGSAWLIAQTVVMSLVGVLAIASGVVGYLRSRLSWWLRLLAVAAGVLMINQGLVTDLIGLSLLALVAVSSHLRARATAGGTSA